MTLDLEQIHEAFFAEAAEALDAMESALLKLGIGSPEPEVVNTIFRVAHSIKGGSATFGFREVVSLAHTLEAVLDELRGSRMQVTRGLSDLLLKSVDVLREMLLASQQQAAIDAQRVADVQFELELAIVQNPRSPAAKVPARMEAPVSRVQQPIRTPPASIAPGTIRISTRKLDLVMNTIGEIVKAHSVLKHVGVSLDGPLAEPLRLGLARLERHVRELQEGVLRIRMLPISSVFSRIPRLVRDLSQRLGKEMELKLTGENTELDKTVLEKIGDPLIHLVRNSIDHGIELPAARRAAGKPAAGMLQLHACHQGGNIVVEVRDDGAGLDRDRILAKARQRGLVGPLETLDDYAICELIFKPGFSTVESATDVSGRGVGMDIVRRNVQQLGGTIEVRTESGKGCCFTMTLPQPNSGRNAMTIRRTGTGSKRRKA